MVKNGRIKEDKRMKERPRTMSDDLKVEKINIINLYDDYVSGKLSINRRYQRKLVWDLQEKKDFIDTLMRKYPMPLILLASYRFLDNNEVRTEIIDGLQRLEAIFSFIFGKYEIHYDDSNKRYHGYFNLDAIPGYGSKIRGAELIQNLPVLPLELCESFLRYEIPCSITETDATNIDEIFRRINSKGRKLSKQDLRQAGVTGKFADLVRKTASYIRGDYSESDIISVNKIELYSLNNKDLNYGIDINDTFWLQQKIINEKQLRNSKDEEIIAHLYIYLLTNGKYSSSSNTLENAYELSNNLKIELDNIVNSDEKILYWMELFSKTISILNKNLKNTNFSTALFGRSRVYNKDYAFIIVFVSIARLLLDSMILTNYNEFHNSLIDLGNKQLTEITRTANAPWNFEVRNRLIERIFNVFKPFFSYNQNKNKEYEEWDVRMVNLIERAEVEEQMFDFKAGITDFNNGKFNIECIRKIVRTMTAMVNTLPNEEGVIILGIPDTPKNASELSSILKAKIVYCKNYAILGIKDEANKYYNGVDSYIKKIKETIEKQPISDSFKNEILTRFKPIEYKNKLLLLFIFKSSVPVFYGRKFFVRYGSHNHEVEIGSDEFNTIQKRFYS